MLNSAASAGKPYYSVPFYDPTMQLLRELSWYFKQQRWRYISAMLMLTAVAFLNLLPPWITGTLVDEALAGTLNSSRLFSLVGSIAVTGLCIYVLRYFWRLSLYSASYQLGALLRQQLHDRLIYQQPDYFRKHHTGDLMARATNDVMAVEMSAGEAVLALFDGLLTGIIVVGVLFLLVDWRLTLIALLPWPLMAYGFWKVNSQLHDAFVLAQGRFGQLNDQVQEHISGLRLIKAFGIEKRAEEDFSKDATAASEANMAVAGAEAKYEPVIIITMGASFLLAVGGGAWLIHLEQFTVGELTRFTLYLGQLIWPMFAYGWLLNLLKRGTVSYQRIQEVLQAPSEIEDCGERPLKRDADICWQIKNFRYPDTEKTVLSDFSGELRPKKMLAIVGPTGSGKSTFLQLLLRFYESEGVSIQLGGLCLQDYSLEDLHQHFSVVPQEPFLFSTSIAENIRLGKADASDEEVKQAAKLAVLHEDIMAFPDAYNTQVGERGVTLSGGQKQRLSIARALLKDAPVLVLDDALSAVDVATEQKILQHLRAQRGDRAIIIVCHRLTAVEHADEIVVLRQGQALERGEHAQLMTQNGWYAEAYRYQQIEQAVAEGR